MYAWTWKKICWFIFSDLKIIYIYFSIGPLYYKGYKERFLFTCFLWIFFFSSTPNMSGLENILSDFFLLGFEKNLLIYIFSDLKIIYFSIGPLYYKGYKELFLFTYFLWIFFFFFNSKYVWPWKYFVWFFFAGVWKKFADLYFFWLEDNLFFNWPIIL